MNVKNVLHQIRLKTGAPLTVGLDDKTIGRFVDADPRLSQVIAAAEEAFQHLETEMKELLKEPEAELIPKLSDRILNFYPLDSVSPYIPLVAYGPWIITCYGSVIYDAGSYGMLGFGHNPKVVHEALSRPYVMANIMTPSLSQKRFADAISSKIGLMRTDGCPYSSFVCMQSGSEAMSVALRITDSNAKKVTDPDGKFPNATIKKLSLNKSFHGRTTGPSRISLSSRPKYSALASFRNVDDCISIAVNDVSKVHEVFDSCTRNNVFIEVAAIEPVMGEGNPGYAITREFYDALRERTKEMGTFLLVDSVQAGLRAHGVLSITDYPGFQDCDPPEMESFSKAISAGQYPFSVLALSEHAASSYARGTYGNTMTANPRGLEVATAVLKACDQSFMDNVQARGKEFREKLCQLQAELPKIITQVQGTGLLLSASICEEISVEGSTGVEQYMRKKGVNVIHGGKNALRYTPVLDISRAEINLIIENTRSALLEFAK